MSHSLDETTIADLVLHARGASAEECVGLIQAATKRLLEFEPGMTVAVRLDLLADDCARFGGSINSAVAAQKHLAASRLNHIAGEFARTVRAFPMSPWLFNGGLLIGFCMGMLFA